jgi:hypothetical protein
VTALAVLVTREAAAAPPDDAFIAWRYVANLLGGHGWVFNQGDAVNATTSPLYVALVTAIAAATGCSIRGAGFVVHAAAIAGGGVALARGMGRVEASRGLRWVTALAYVLSPLHAGTFGLETPLQLGLIACLWCVGQRRVGAAAGTIAALAVLARPDCVLFVGAVLLATPRPSIDGGSRQPLAPRRFTVACVATLAPWLAFAIADFGSPLPATMAAKMAQGASGWWEADRYLRSLQVSLQAFDRWHVLGSYKPFLVVGAAGAIAMVRSRPWRPFIAYAAAHAACYRAIGVPFYHWYAAPLHLVVVLAGGAIGSIGGRWSAWSRRTGLAVAGLVAASAADFRGPQPREHGYLTAGAWIAANSPETASVACAEIGMLGLAVHPRPIVDLAGLVTPRAIEHLRDRDLGWVLRGELPQFFALHEPPWRELETTITDDPRFIAAYQRVPLRLADGVVVWRRTR